MSVFVIACNLIQMSTLSVQLQLMGTWFYIEVLKKRKYRGAAIVNASRGLIKAQGRTGSERYSNARSQVHRGGGEGP